MYIFDTKDFQKKIKEAQGEKYASAFAKEVGVSTANFSRAINAKMVSTNTLIRISNALGFDPRSFFKLEL